MRSIIAMLVAFAVGCSAIPFEDGRGGDSGGGGSGGGGGGTKVKNHRVRIAVPTTDGSIIFTDNNVENSMRSSSLPIKFVDVVIVDPYGHTNRLGQIGVELQVRSPNGNEWGCRETSKNACDAPTYASDDDGKTWWRVFGEPLSNSWTCDGVKPANCFFPATELDP